MKESSVADNAEKKNQTGHASKSFLALQCAPVTLQGLLFLLLLLLLRQGALISLIAAGATGKYWYDSHHHRLYSRKETLHSQSTSRILLNMIWVIVARHYNTQFGFV